MYKNLSANDFKKILSLTEDYKIDSILIYGTWNRDKQESVLKEILIEQKINFEINKLSDFLSNVLEIKIDDKIIWFYVAYGGALLSEYLHLGCLFGSQKNILLGSCGGLKKGAKKFDFIIPTKSYGKKVPQGCILEIT